MQSLEKVVEFFSSLLCRGLLFSRWCPFKGGVTKVNPFGIQYVSEFIGCQNREILNDASQMEAVISELIQKAGFGLRKVVSYGFEPQGVTCVAILSESHLAIHTYPEARHASIDLYTCEDVAEKTEKLFDSLKELFRPEVPPVLEISRGNPIGVKEKNRLLNYTHNAGFDILYHVDQWVYQKKSKYQLIEVIDNPCFGRMLFLDRDLQIAESDAHLYHEGLFPKEVGEKAKGGKVLILGGGDGGIVWKALQYSPEKVTLVDIDPEVIQCAKTYLRSICKDAFDDPRVEVVHTDAYEYISTEERFDVVVYDLTLAPESFSNIERSQFIDQVAQRIRKLLKPNGIYTMQASSVLDTPSLKMYKEILPKYFQNIQYRTAFIPSFCEEWCFLTASPKPEE